MVILTTYVHGPERLARVAMIVSLLAANSQVLADTLTVPNEFAPGTPARSADVNENFAAVESAVNDNDSRITAIERRGAVIVYGGAGNNLHEPAGVLSRLYGLSGVVRWYYSDRESVAVANVTMNSGSSPAGCLPLDFPLDSEFVWPATVNDAAVTGVSELSCNVPIKFQCP